MHVSVFLHAFIGICFAELFLYCVRSDDVDMMAYCTLCGCVQYLYSQAMWEIRWIESMHIKM